MASFGFYLKEGLSGFLRNRSATVSAIAITTLILFIMSLFLLIIFNIRLIIEEAKKGLFIYVYLVDEHEDTELIKEKIYEIEGIENIDFISKKEAEREFRQTFKDEAYMLDVLDRNYFPSSYRIEVVEGMKNEEAIADISSKISSIEGVDEVDFGREWVERISSFENKLRIFGLVIGVLLALINIIIVSNAIRLIILGRTEKITIIRLVGATDGFIRTPFIIEGLIIGALGGVLALAILYGINAVLSGYGVLDFQKLPLLYNLAIVVGGAVLGVIASYISTSTYLRKLR